MIKLILVDDHPQVRAGLSSILEGLNQMVVVAQAENGQELLNLLAKGIAADMVLSDVEMPVMDGVSMLSKVAILYPDLFVVMLSMNDRGDAVTRAFALGAKGFISKSIDLELLCSAIVYMHANPGQFSCGLPQGIESCFTAIDQLILA